MRRRTATLYELETAFREQGWPSDLVYDAEHDLYRVPDGEFAFSRQYANERRLREMGIIGLLRAYSSVGLHQPFLLMD